MAFKMVVYLLALLPYSVAKSASQPIHELRKGTVPDLSRRHQIQKRDVDPSILYPAHNLSVPIDHFHNESMYEPHSDGKFNLRYWFVLFGASSSQLVTGTDSQDMSQGSGALVTRYACLRAYEPSSKSNTDSEICGRFDATYYKEGGPVIVLESGETSGVGRLPYLQKGILHQLAEATNGIGVVLEHRYYGTSFPTRDLSTENLRFLTTRQALADTAYFAQNVVFEGLEGKNLTAPNTAYIAYGGSYAGAFVAFLRTTYPDVYFGEQNFTTLLASS